MLNCFFFVQLQSPVQAHPPTIQSPPPPTSQLSPQPPQQTQQPVALVSTEDITIFAYQDLKLGQVIKDQELLKLILRALKWNDVGKTIDFQLERLRSTSFRAVLSSPELLSDEDLVQLLGPYLNHGSFAVPDHSKVAGSDYNAKLLEQNVVTEMEVGVDPELFLFDDEDTKSVEQEESVQKAAPLKREARKPVQRNRTTNKRLATVTAVPPIKVTKVEAQPAKSKSKSKEVTAESPLKAQPVVEKATKQKSLPDKSNDISTQETTVAEKEVTPVQNSVPEPAVAAPTETQTPTKTTNKPTRQRKPRKKKEEVSAPKTRTRSVFSLKHKCGVCGKKLSTTGNLKAHMKTHKPKGKFGCEKCGRV